MQKRMEHVCNVLAVNVKTLRLNCEISQEELAFRAGLDRTYISQIERAIGNPSVLVLVKISNVLGVDIQELFIKNL